VRPTPAPPSLPYPRDTKEPKGFRPPRRQRRQHIGKPAIREEAAAGPGRPTASKATPPTTLTHTVGGDGRHTWPSPGSIRGGCMGGTTRKGRGEKPPQRTKTPRRVQQLTSGSQPTRRPDGPRTRRKKGAPVSTPSQHPHHPATQPAGQAGKAMYTKRCRGRCRQASPDRPVADRDEKACTPPPRSSRPTRW
jgi:hypothetical protein